MEDTIVAPATAPGSGAIAVVRISGPKSLAILQKIFSAHEKLCHSLLVHGVIRSGDRVVDDVMAVYFAAPASYTGEDCAEIHCHASVYGVYEILNCIIQSGARSAQPGEFTRRAFLNGKMDLTQAEAVCDFISASSGAGARAAQLQLQGELKKKILILQDELGDILAEIEAAVEYPEEDLELPIVKKAVPYLESLVAEIRRLASTYDTGRIIKDGFRVAIAGKPNVGKSSILNALCGMERAIVTDVAGTTRDTIGETVFINSVALILTDTAGIRETSDTIEAMGVARSMDAARDAALTLFVLDGTAPLQEEDKKAYAAIEGNVVAVVNKTDATVALKLQEIEELIPKENILWVSALTGEGLDELKKVLYHYAVADQTATEGVLITNTRHRELLLAAAEQMDDAINALRAGMDMDCVTIDLNCAWASIGGITGNTVTEDIIDKIFDKFCLGK